jgi:hypothetical protein
MYQEIKEADEPATRRVTPDGQGGFTGGLKPMPRDPNQPVDTKRQAFIQAKQDAESAMAAWIATRPKRADGRPMPSGLRQDQVAQVLAGADPATVIMGKANAGAFGEDPSQYRALAQQYLVWLSKQPPKFDSLDPKWD